MNTGILKYVSSHRNTGMARGIFNLEAQGVTETVGVGVLVAQYFMFRLMYCRLFLLYSAVVSSLPSAFKTSPHGCWRLLEK